jgi:hypothetical protein
MILRLEEKIKQDKGQCYECPLTCIEIENQHVKRFCNKFVGTVKFKK